MNSRLGLDRLTIFGFLIVIGFFIADLGLLMLRGGMFPQQPPPARPIQRPMQQFGGSSLAVITQRNVFNSDGKIAPAKGDNGNRTSEAPKCPDEPPASQLPIVLMGTIVHADPHRSIATVTSKSKNDQFAVKVDGTIPDNVAVVKAIARNRVVVLAPGKPCPEFIEMKDDSKLSFSQAQAKPAIQNGPVMQKSDTEFELKRNDIDKLTSNLPELLQQARAVPRMGPNGTIECFSMADIAAGSIYEKLGIRKGDCIKGVNGERIDSPAKAMELYNALRSSANSINLSIERGGRDENMNYNITQ